MMEPIMQILHTALEALSECNVSQPTEVEIFQGIQPSDWWVHTDVGYYVNVHPLRGLPGLQTSVHTYISYGVTPDEIGELSDINLHGHESQEAAYRKEFGL